VILQRDNKFPSQFFQLLQRQSVMRKTLQIGTLPSMVGSRFRQHQDPTTGNLKIILLRNLSSGLKYYSERKAADAADGDDGASNVGECPVASLLQHGGVAFRQP
jgi:hypothetical protein